MHHYLIPANLSIKEIEAMTPKRGKIPGYKVEKLLYAIHIIMESMAHSDDVEDGISWVRLHSKILIAVMGKYYNRYFDLLLKKGILIVRKKGLSKKGSYQPGRYSKSFALGGKYIGGVQTIERPQAQWIPKKIYWYNIKGELEKNEGKRGKGTQFSQFSPIAPNTINADIPELLDKWFNSLLNVDDAGAKLATLSILEDTTPRYKYRKIQYVGKDGKLKTFRKKQKIDPKLSYARANAQIELLKANNYRIVHRDDRIARLYSPLVSLNKVVRPYLSYDGQQLGYIDVKNSQPFLILALFTPDFWASSSPHLVRMFCRAFPNHQSNPCRLTFEKIGYADFLFPDTRQGNERYKKVLDAVMKIQSSHDAQQYKTSVQNGTFYQNMMDAIFKGRTVAEIKDYMFTVMFTANQYFAAKKAWPKRKFKELYPSVYQLLSAIKSGDKDKLPLLLQRLESHIVIDLAATRITKQLPDVPIYPIHDGMATIAHHVGDVLRVLKGTFANSIGLIPRFHNVVWHPP